MSHAKLTDRVWNIVETKQWSSLGEVFTEDTEFHMPGMPPMKGLSQVGPMLQAYMVAFPDLKHTVHEVLESGDVVAVRLDVTGTQTGPMQTPQGVLPPNGKKMVWNSVDWITVRDGKVAKWLVYQDSAAFLRHIGVLPA